MSELRLLYKSRRETAPPKTGFSADGEQIGIDLAKCEFYNWPMDWSNLGVINQILATIISLSRLWEFAAQHLFKKI
jgi:hypothetical protein